MLTPDCNIVLDSRGRVTQLDTAAQAAFGYRRHEAAGMALDLILDWQSLPADQHAVLNQLLQTGKGNAAGRWYQAAATRRDRSAFPAQFSITAARHRGRLFFNVVLRDVGPHQLADEALQRLRRLERDHREFLRQLAREEPLTEILTGLALLAQRQWPPGQACLMLQHDGRLVAGAAPSLGDEFMRAVTAASYAPAGEDVLAIDLLCESRWQPHLPLLERLGINHAWMAPITTGDGNPSGALWIFWPKPASPLPEDIELLQSIAGKAAIAVRRNQLAERVAHQAMHDPLSGLANRTLLDDRAGQAIARARRGREQVGVFLIDVDDFKIINDTLGYALGDELLRQLAARLQSAVRQSDTLARTGSDEFVLIAANVAERAGAEAVGEKLLRLAAIPFQLDGREVVFTSSIGASVFPPDGQEFSALHGNAGAALLQAKKNGRNRVVYAGDMGTLAA